MLKKQKLGIAIPLVDDKVHTVFLDTFVAMKKPDFVYLRPQFHSMDIALIRNQLIRQALDSKCTHILMLDSDQAYHDPDMIFKLLKHDLPVVSCIVHRRYPPFDMITLRGEPGKYLMVPDEEIIKARENYPHLIEIDATGCGCLLYKAEVFENIPQPWFEFTKTEDGDVVGEDIGFCNKLKQAGYNIHCDTSIKIGHMSNLEVSWGTYQLYSHLKKLQREEDIRDGLIKE